MYTADPAIQLWLAQMMMARLLKAMETFERSPRRMGIGSTKSIPFRSIITDTIGTHFAISDCFTRQEGSHRFLEFVLEGTGPRMYVIEVTFVATAFKIGCLRVQRRKVASLRPSHYGDADAARTLERLSLAVVWLTPYSLRSALDPNGWCHHSDLN